MRYLAFVIAIIVTLAAYPRKTLTRHSMPKSASSLNTEDTIQFRKSHKVKTKHSIPKKQDYSYEDNAVHFISADSIQSIKKDNYTLLINYSDGNPFEWGIIGQSRAVQFDSDPRLMPVYFNPASPRFFHAFPDCKKIGAFRKLSETPIQDFIKSNKTANICPDCMQRHKSFFLVTQFILDD